MRSLLVLVVASSLFCGCRCQAPPAVDPFFGRTRVEPPATGCISSAPVDPYFRAPTVGTSSRAMEPRAPTPIDASAPATARREGPPSGATLAGRQRVIRILQPRPKTAQRPSADPGPGSLTGPTAPEQERAATNRRVVDIMELPKAGTPGTASKIPSAAQPGGFRLVSGTTTASSESSESPESPESPGVSAVSKTSRSSDDSAQFTVVASSASGDEEDATKQFTPHANYGHDPAYGWLRGKLEYSQIDSRWKLRYIPIDGKTDKYGGSVVLADPALLGGCERGDFVEINGRLGGQDPKNGFAPTYHPAEVKRL